MEWPRGSGNPLARLLGVLHNKFRVLDRHQPRGNADLGNPATRECDLAAAGDAVRRGHHRLCFDDRSDVPDHSSWAAVAFLLAHPVSERTANLAEPAIAAGAIFSGIAALILAMAVLRKALHLEEYLHPVHFQNLGKLLLMMSLLWGYFTFAERLTTWYGNNSAEMAVFWETQTGAYAPLFWTMVFCNFVIPFPLLAIRRLRTITATVIAFSLIVVGMWLERFLIIVPSLATKHLPYAWGTYRPQPVEIMITVATFAAMTLLYALFAKSVPIISIWELNVGGHV